MRTRNVVLTDHQEKLVDELVTSGRYQNASEVLRDGLRLVEGREEDEKAKRKALREAARIGIAHIEAGRYLEFKTPKALRSYLTKLADSAIKAGSVGPRNK